MPDESGVRHYFKLVELKVYWTVWYLLR